MSATEGEFTHCIVDSFSGIQAPAILVGIPEGADIWKAGLFRGWRADQASVGQHVATIRTVLLQYRRRYASPSTSPSTSPVTFPAERWGTGGTMSSPRLAPVYRSSRGGGRSC